MSIYLNCKCGSSIGITEPTIEVHEKDSRKDIFYCPDCCEKVGDLVWKDGINTEGYFV